MSAFKDSVVAEKLVKDSKKLSVDQFKEIMKCSSCSDAFATLATQELLKDKSLDESKLKDFSSKYLQALDEITASYTIPNKETKLNYALQLKQDFLNKLFDGVAQEVAEGMAQGAVASNTHISATALVNKYGSRWDKIFNSESFVQYQNAMDNAMAEVAKQAEKNCNDCNKAFLSAIEEALKTPDKKITKEDMRATIDASLKKINGENNGLDHRKYSFYSKDIENAVDRFVARFDKDNLQELNDVEKNKLIAECEREVTTNKYKKIACAVVTGVVCLAMVVAVGAAVATVGIGGIGVAAAAGAATIGMALAPEVAGGMAAFLGIAALGAVAFSGKKGYQHYNQEMNIAKGLKDVYEGKKPEEVVNELKTQTPEQKPEQQTAVPEQPNLGQTITEQQKKQEEQAVQEKTSKESNKVAQKTEALHAKLVGKVTKKDTEKTLSESKKSHVDQLKQKAKITNPKGMTK